MDKKPIMLMMKLLCNEWAGYLRKITLESGVPDTYRPLIMFLSFNPGASQKMLAEHRGVSHAAISQTVKEMIRDGYARRQADSDDQRITRLYLTEKGEKAFERIRDKIRAADQMIAETIGSEKEEEMTSLMQMISETIKRSMAND